jgi:hypothetical protein
MPPSKRTELSSVVEGARRLSDKEKKPSSFVIEDNVCSSTKASIGLRQSDRVSLRVPVEASWATSSGTVIKHTAETLLVSRNGGVVRLDEKLSTGQELHLRRSKDGDRWKSARARVVAEIDQEPPRHFIYAIHILNPDCDFWDIDFPSPDTAEEALARLLMECSFCQYREVVYMNEMQVKSFEIRKCIARFCKQCGFPVHLDRFAFRSAHARGSRSQPHTRRARDRSQAQPPQTPHPCLRSPAQLPGRNRRLRRFVQRRSQLPQPQSLS